MANWGLIGQELAIAVLLRTLEQGRVPHAYLLMGVSGLGKRTAALEVASRLLCIQSAAPAAPSCGQCFPCRHYQAGSSPDWVELAAETGEEIRIASVREIGHWAYLKPRESHHRLVLIDPVEAMTPYAANALLKTLEEPPDALTFILISHRPERVPATIRSRCQPVAFRPAAVASVEHWLLEERGVSPDKASLAARLAGGCPGQALNWLEQPLVQQRDAVVSALEASRLRDLKAVLQTAQQWSQGPVASWYPFVMAWLQDLYRVKVVGEGVERAVLVNGDRVEQLQRHARELSYAELEQVQRVGRQLEGNLARRANPLLAIEDFLLCWRCPEQAQIVQ